MAPIDEADRPRPIDEPASPDDTVEECPVDPGPDRPPSADGLELAAWHEDGAAGHDPVVGARRHVVAPDRDAHEVQGYEFRGLAHHRRAGRGPRQDQVPDVLGPIDVVVVDLGHEAAISTPGGDSEGLAQDRCRGQRDDPGRDGHRRDGLHQIFGRLDAVQADHDLEGRVRLGGHHPERRDGEMRSARHEQRGDRRWRPDEERVRTQQPRQAQRGPVAAHGRATLPDAPDLPREVVLRGTRQRRPEHRQQGLVEVRRDGLGDARAIDDDAAHRDACHQPGGLGGRDPVEALGRDRPPSGQRLQGQGIERHGQGLPGDLVGHLGLRGSPR